MNLNARKAQTRYCSAVPDAPLPTATFRAQLRAATTSAHARVDALMSHGLGSDADYRAYLRGMHAFVAGMMPRVSAAADTWSWPLPDWDGMLRRDLHGVDPEGHALPVDTAAPLAPDEALGALYVMEGSALGARVLLRDATALGHAPERGAAFLHAHATAEDGRRWPRFLALLEPLGSRLDRDRACAGARQTFQLAERCFRRARGMAP